MIPAVNTKPTAVECRSWHRRSQRGEMCGMNEPAVILHIFGRMQRGGAELRTLSLMRHIDRTRWRFNFGVLSGLPGELDSAIRELGGEVHPMRLGLGFPARFLRVIRKAHVSVVHSHVHHSSGLILALASLCGVQTRIAHFRSTGDGQPATLRRRLQRFQMKRWIDRYATHILAVGEGAMSSAWKADWASDSRCRIVYNGLDLTPFKAKREHDEVREEFGLPKDSTLYCHVGTLHRDKNHLRLVEIFAAVLRRRPDARLLMVGKEDDLVSPEVKRRADELGIRDAVRFAGVRADVPRLLLAADGMIYPSLREGLPGAVLEACAAGLPVVASKLSGTREIARYFPEVRTLSLEQSDQDWADLALESTGTGSRSRACRDDPELAFSETPFTMEKGMSQPLLNLVE